MASASASESPSTSASTSESPSLSVSATASASPSQSSTPSAAATRTGSSGSLTGGVLGHLRREYTSLSQCDGSNYKALILAPSGGCMATSLTSSQQVWCRSAASGYTRDFPSSADCSGAPLPDVEIPLNNFTGTCDDSAPLVSFQLYCEPGSFSVPEQGALLVSQWRGQNSCPAAGAPSTIAVYSTDPTVCGEWDLARGFGYACTAQGAERLLFSNLQCSGAGQATESFVVGCDAAAVGGSTLTQCLPAPSRSPSVSPSPTASASRTGTQGGGSGGGGASAASEAKLEPPVVFGLVLLGVGVALAAAFFFWRWVSSLSAHQVLGGAAFRGRARQQLKLPQLEAGANPLHKPSSSDRSKVEQWS